MISVNQSKNALSNICWEYGPPRMNFLQIDPGSRWEDNEEAPPQIEEVADIKNHWQYKAGLKETTKSMIMAPQEQTFSTKSKSKSK